MPMTLDWSVASCCAGLLWWTLAHTVMCLVSHSAWKFHLLWSSWDRWWTTCPYISYRYSAQSWIRRNAEWAFIFCVYLQFSLLTQGFSVRRMGFFSWLVALVFVFCWAPALSCPFHSPLSPEWGALPLWLLGTLQWALPSSCSARKRILISPSDLPSGTQCGSTRVWVPIMCWALRRDK